MITIALLGSRKLTKNVLHRYHYTVESRCNIDNHGLRKENPIIQLEKPDIDLQALAAEPMGSSIDTT